MIHAIREEVYVCGASHGRDGGSSALVDCPKCLKILNKKKKCYLCGLLVLQGDLVRHSYDSLDGEAFEIDNCEDTAACFERCHENAKEVRGKKERK